MKCERMHATIPVATCVKRQEMWRTDWGPSGSGRFLECQRCEQGELARRGDLGDEDMEIIKTAVVGNETMDEPRVQGPDNHATDRRQGAGPVAPESAAPAAVPTICKVCRSREADHPVRDGWCGKCVAKDLTGKRNAKKAARKNAAPPAAPLTSSSVGRFPQPAPVRYQPVEAEEEIVLTGNHVLLDFAGREALLQRIRALAEEEVRTVENQIIYLVKIAIKGGRS